MEEITVNGLVAGGEDYGESDRLVRLLTAELGLVTARMRGVKKEKAKLKFAATPFALCEYVLIKRNGFYTVKTASQTESLFSVCGDPDKYIVGSLMIETAAASAEENESAERFVSLLTALKRLIYSDVDPYSIGLNYVYSLILKGGYAVAGERQKEFSVPVEEQKSLGDSALAKRLLKKYSELFEDRFYVKLKSAALL